MKSKLFLLVIFILTIIQSKSLEPVPDTETFTLQDVYNVVHAENASTQYNLSSCFTYATSGNFDSDYTSYPANSLLRFRNYGATGSPTFSIVSYDHTVALTSNPSTKSLTISSGNILVVYIAIVSYGTDGALYRTGGTPTWNGTSMTQVGSYSGSYYSEMWYIINPTTGTHTLSIPNSANVNMQVVSSWYTSTGTISLANYTANNNTTSFIGGSTTVPANKSLLIVEGYSMRNPSGNSTGMGYSYTYTDSPISYIVGSAVFGSGSQYKSYYNNSPTSYSISWTSSLTDKHWYDTIGVFKSE